MNAAVDVAQVVTAIAAVLGIGVAVFYSNRNLQRTDHSLKQNHDIVGAQTGMLYRDQVLKLLELGLTPAKVRAILSLEDGGEGYEAAYGSIDAIADLVARD